MASRAQEITLIGVCDGELDSRRFQASFLTNKVGGQPDWLPVISRRSPRCGRCGSLLVHVVQVYCPLDASPYHRNLHLFACAGAGCGGGAPESWRVLRSQCLETAVAPSRPAPAQEAPLSATDWCDAADDWGVEEQDGRGRVELRSGGVGHVQVETEVPCDSDVCSRLQDLRLEQFQQDVPVLRPFFISVLDESDLAGAEDDLLHAQQLLEDYERREGMAVRALEDGGKEETYEKASARHGDAVFSRFMKKISPCPQQILRYCRGGDPLFISEPPSSMARAVPACGVCGGSRTFELQLMPALVSLLQTAGGETELEFGTVLVYSCTSSCWVAGSGSAVDEFCFVQSDPDQQLFK